MVVDGRRSDEFVRFSRIDELLESLGDPRLGADERNQLHLLKRHRSERHDVLLIRAVWRRKLNGHAPAEARERFSTGRGEEARLVVRIRGDYVDAQQHVGLRWTLRRAGAGA